MSIVTLSLAKAHLKIAGDSEDELINLYIRSAEAWFENYIGKKLSSFDPLPGDLENAILDLVAFRYQMRGIASFGVPMHVGPADIYAVANSHRERWFGEPEPEPVEDAF